MQHSTRRPTVAQWWAGARPRTLAAAIAPVVVGTGAAAAAGGAVPLRAALALVVALLLQIGVNYANDYSDGIRGTDAIRVGPMRLVGSRVAEPAAVKRAAFACFGAAAVAGFGLVALSGAWWLLAVGAAAIAAAWGYTGGRSPYGYRGLGEVSVFVFFGLVAVLGTMYTQVGAVSWAGFAGAVAIGCYASALLVVNNLRDAPNDARVGKRTVAVRLGDRRTRALLTALLLVPTAAAGAIAVGAALTGGSGSWWWTLAALIGLAPTLAATRVVGAGASGPALVPVLGLVSRAELAYAVGLGCGLALVGA